MQKPVTPADFGNDPNDFQEEMGVPQEILQP